MRTIKFRAWYKKDSRMIDLYKITPRILNESIDGLFIPFGDEYELMQFTGLLDKNGKKIYEGDILMMDSWNPSNYQIKFMEGAFCLAFYGGKFDGEYAGDIHYIHHAEIPQATVKGNIYENPELLAQ